MEKKYKLLQNIKKYQKYVQKKYGGTSKSNAWNVEIASWSSRLS